MRKWRIEDSEELYNITGWGTSYFGINDKGHVVVTPRKDGVGVDLKDLVDELQLRDVTAPMLVRFPDILDNRIEKISCCFRQAAEEYGYKAENFIIYPIKVNQMRPVVEEIISHGKKFNLGLEAGSKPELHAVIAINMDSDSLIICNGYKDESYIELALLAQKMGKRIFLVVEKMNELKLIAKIGETVECKAQYRHTYQAGFVGKRQVGRFGRRCKQVRTVVQRIARSARLHGKQRHAGLPEADTFPHRKPGNENPSYQNRSA